MLAGVIDPDYRGSFTTAPQWRKGRVCLDYRRSLREFLSITVRCVMVHGQLQQSNPGRATNGPYHSVMKV